MTIEDAYTEGFCKAAECIGIRQRFMHDLAYKQAQATQLPQLPDPQRGRTWIQSRGNASIDAAIRGRKTVRRSGDRPYAIPGTTPAAKNTPPKISDKIRGVLQKLYVP